MIYYEKLYKRKENGVLYTWSIEYILIQEIPYICVLHGKKDGKMVKHIKEIIPKAKRTHLEQFDIIASKKWNDKIKKEGYSTSIVEAEENNTKSINHILIHPMLADKFYDPNVDMEFKETGTFNKKKWLIFDGDSGQRTGNTWTFRDTPTLYATDPKNYFISEKFDGVRSVWNGKNFTSRTKIYITLLNGLKNYYLLTMF